MRIGFLTVLLILNGSMTVFCQKDQVLVFAENEGPVTVYNLTQRIFKTITFSKERIVDNSLRFLNDSTIVFAYKTLLWDEAISTKTGEKMICPSDNCDEDILHGIFSSAEYDRYEYFREDYYAFSITDSSNWLQGTILYELKNRRQLSITYTLFDSIGSTILNNTETCYCKHGTQYNDGRFNCLREGELLNQYRFYSESNSVAGKTVYSKGGDLFLKTESDTLLIVDWTEHWDFKFGNGYYQPCLSSTGNQLVFLYSTGYYDEWGTAKHAVLLYDMRTKKIKTLLKENCAQPTFSNDDMFLLMNRIEKTMGNEWSSTIILYNLETATYEELGSGGHFAWKN